MDELIRSGGGAEDTYKRYEELIFERDRLEKEADQIGLAYTRTFGQLMTDVYEEKIECIKLRKMIAFYQAAANRGEQADMEEMIAYLQQEMAEYYANLEHMVRRNEAAKKSRVITEYEEKRIKALYRHIAKLLHPDIHPEVREDDFLMDLWTAAATAYHANDLKRLMDVEIMIQKALKDGAPPSGMGLVEINARIEEIEEEIEEIRTTEPYIWHELLDDEAAKQKRITELKAELEQYREYRRGLEQVLDGLMNA